MGDPEGIRAVFLNLWFLTALGVEGPFHRGYISDSLHIRYLYHNYNNSKVVTMK